MPLLETGDIMDLDDDPRSDTANTQRQLRFSHSKLKASSNTSALLVGFAMVALVEFELRSPGRIQEVIGTGWLIVFGVITCSLISVHLIALIVSTCVLPQMEYANGIINRREQPHIRFRPYIETAWILSTVLGLILFLLEVAVMCLIKFGAIEHMAAGFAAVAVLGITLVAFLVFVHYFYRTLYRQKIRVISNRLRELEKSYESLQVLSNETGMGTPRRAGGSPVSLAKFPCHQCNPKIPTIIVTADIECI